MNRKFNRTRANALAFAMALATGIFAVTAEVTVSAQDHSGHAGQAQSGDMPSDLHYIDMMVMHHEQGVEMARLAEEKGQNAAVKAFAKKTGGGQQNDIKELQRYRDTWYAGRPQMDHAQMMSHMGNMPGHKGMKMDMEGDMAKLRAATGREFDRLFLDTMSSHHQMAVGMSKEAATKAEHAEIKRFAGKTATKQQGEIAEMNRLRASVGGKVARKPAPKKKPAAKKSGHSGHTMH